jgi:beta-hydroxylase
MEPFDRVSMHIKWWPFRFLEWLNRLASKVGQDPVLDNAKFDWIPVIEAATDDILAELHNIQATENIPSTHDILENQVVLSDDDQWKLFFHYGYGYRDERNCKLCPATDRAVQSVAGLQSVMYSILEPGKRLRPHRGPYNGLLRYHLGLIIPDDGMTCGLRVAEESCHWQVGQSLVFDDTNDHEAWNDSDKQRVVLFLDFERPLRFPINYLNKFVLFVVRLSPPIRQAIRNIKNYRGRKPATVAS